MRSLITRSIVLPAPADILYKIYLNSELHAAFTGGPAEIHPEPGGTFTAFNGALTGRMIHVVKSRLIVQTWRSVSFNSDDPDTTLILNFSNEGENGRIDMVHMDVPRHDYNSVKKGWSTFYWNPLKTYLSEQPVVSLQ